MLEPSPENFSELEREKKEYEMELAFLERDHAFSNREKRKGLQPLIALYRWLLKGVTQDLQLLEDKKEGKSCFSCDAGEESVSPLQILT
ncbi:hypothetical protein JXA05_01610 [Candidatus Peregrinibacteria bacterium]|nr:hypothetical protein [Candidatus Peregrinibacteria bacterium]